MFRDDYGLELTVAVTGNGDDDSPCSVCIFLGYFPLQELPQLFPLTEFFS